MFQNADEVNKFIADEDVKFVDVRFCDLPGVMQHFTVPGRRRSTRPRSWRSTARRSAASRPSTSPTWRCAPTCRPPGWTRSAGTRRSTSTSSSTTRSPASSTAATRATWPRRPRRTSPPPASPTPRTSVPRRSSTSSTACASRPGRTRRSTTSTPRPAPGTPARWRTTAATRSATRAATSRPRRSTTSPTCAPRSAWSWTGSGLQVERQHHEVGTAGQAEINYKFNTLLAAADDLMLFKYIVKNVAWRNGKTATFMPKPIFGDNGSGMHVHQSLWTGGNPLFYDEQGYAGLSDTARYYIGGILKHAPSLLAFTNPTVNSYHRLVPGFEAPVNLVYSQRNRSAAIRIPITGCQPEGQAHRVPRAGPVLQPVPGLLGPAAGRPGRHQEQDRARGAGRQGPLRAGPRGARGRPAGPDLPPGRPRRARGGPRVPPRRAASSPPT